MKKFLVFVLAVLMCVSTLAGCTGNDKDTASGEKVITCGSTGYFAMDSMDPASGFNGQYWHLTGVVETLFKLDEKYDAHSYLAKSYNKLDELTWELTINDATFHNGEKVTAQAVKECFERTVETNSRAKEQIYFDTMTANGQVLTIKTEQPNPTMINDLCDPVWSIYDAKNSDFSTTLFATGPFKVESFDAKIQTTVVKYPEYWGGQAKIDKAVLKTVGDADALTMALQNGELDLAFAMPSQSIPLFTNDSSFVVDSAAAPRPNVLYYNLERIPDISVRTAIAMSIDRDGIAKGIFSGLADATYGIFPDFFDFGGTQGLNPKVTSFDVEGAKKLLSDAGYADTNGNGILDKNGKELSYRAIAISSRKELAQIGDMLQSQLKEIGIELKFDLVENTTSIEKAGECDISIRSFGQAPTGNPQYYFNTHLISTASNNVARFNNETFDGLAKKLETTSEDSERTSIIRRMSQILLDESPVTVFCFQKTTSVYNKKITGFKSQPSEYYLIDANIDIQ